MEESYTVETYRDREEWLKNRRRNGAVGGSEAAAIWNASPYDSAFSLYVKKLSDEKFYSDEQEAEWLNIGNVLEEPISKLYAQKRKAKLVDPGRNTIFRSKKWPWMFVSVDRIAEVPERDGYGVLEVKNRSAWSAKSWDEEVPVEIQLQVQHAMAVTGFRWSSVAVLLGGSSFRWVDIERDDDLIKLHVEACKKFSRHVEFKQPPETDGSLATEEALKKLYCDSNDQSIDLGKEVEELYNERQEMKEVLKGIEDKCREYENKIRSAMGNFSVAKLPSGGQIKLQTVTRKSHQVSESTFRRMTFLKGKK